MEDAMTGALLGGITGGIMGAMRGDRFLGSVMQGVLLGGGAATLIGAKDRLERAARAERNSATVRNSGADVQIRFGTRSSGMDYARLLGAFPPETRGASHSDINALPICTISKDDITGRLSQDNRSCCICMDDFKPGDVAKRLPCLHMYHETCVDEWLRTNGCCPICKHVVGGH